MMSSKEISELLQLNTFFQLGVGSLLFLSPLVLKDDSFSLKLGNVFTLIPQALLRASLTLLRFLGRINFGL